MLKPRQELKHSLADLARPCFSKDKQTKEMSKQTPVFGKLKEKDNGVGGILVYNTERFCLEE